MKCLAKEGNFTFVIPEVRVKFFKGCVCREAGQSTEDQASGEGVVWSTVRKRG